MKWYNYLIFTLLFLLITCEKEEEKDRGNEFTVLVKGGNNQSGYYGEKLSRDISILVMDKNATPCENFTVDFEIEQGGGSITNNIMYTNSAGIASNSWIMGCSSEQKLNAIVYDSLYNIIDTLRIIATAEKRSGWNKCCGVILEPNGNVADVHGLSLHPSGRIYLTAWSHNYTKSGLQYSDDHGVSWNYVQNFPMITNLSNVTCTQNGTIYVSSGDNGILKSTDNGENWQYCRTGIEDYRYMTNFSVISENELYYSSSFGGVYHSVDGGNSWTRLDFSGSDLTYGNKTCISKHPDGEIFLLGHFGDIYYSEDNGVSWNEVEMNYIGNITSMKMDDKGNVFVGIDGTNPTLYISRDKCKSWEKLYEAGTIPHATFDIYLLKIIDEDIYVSSLMGLYKVNLNGNATKIIDAEDHYYCICINSEGNLLVGGDNGAYYNF